MKNFYAVLLLFIATSIAPNILFAQCDDVTIASLTNPGPYTVGTLTEADGLRNGPNYSGATVYYPTDATPPYASIAIVPGFVSQPSSVEEWGPFYASHGIVAIIIGTNSLFDFPEQRAAALLDALETMRQENTRTASPLLNNIDIDKFAVSGWSMGGGGAQLAAVLDSSIKGVVALCPWLTNPSLDHDSPVIIFSGQNDPTAPPAQHANIHYNATPDTTNKLLFEIENGNHSVANTPSGGDGVIGKLALSWFKLYVEENDCYCPLLKDELLVNPPAASKVLSSFECELLAIADNPFNNSIVLYPNPAKNSLQISSQNQNIDQVIIYSVLGSKILEMKVDAVSPSLDVSSLATGVYYVQLYSGNKVAMKKFMKE